MSTQVDVMMFSASKVHSQRDVHLSLFELLVNSKCDVNIADKLGWTPLYQAAIIGETGKYQRPIQGGPKIWHHFFCTP